jgi:hypothetical protein
MTDDKKTIALFNREKKSAASTIDADIFLRNPEALKEHINSVAAVDAKTDVTSPDKPATRVTSLDSFLTKSPQSSLSLKKQGETAFETEGNVKAFTRQKENKSRKK